MSYFTTDQEVINEFLTHTLYGTLSLVSKGMPYSIPINYVYINEHVYLHGGKGNKINILRANSNVAFSIVEPYSCIQMNISDTEHQRPSFQFYKSVNISGKAELVINSSEKKDVIHAFMKKFERDSAWEDYSEQEMTHIPDSTHIIKIHQKSMKAKFKFGQMLSDEEFASIKAYLSQSDSPIDKKSLELMERLRSEV